eukprot:GEMP01083240.1.p1 GENE.GEMP01083240.1~~GEMP01083240.1.p1  ORF type:complete len:304 (+),score=49.66 GEMP01083240.1:69-980(+)
MMRLWSELKNALDVIDASDFDELNGGFVSYVVSRAVVTNPRFAMLMMDGLKLAKMHSGAKHYVEDGQFAAHVRSLGITAMSLGSLNEVIPNFHEVDSFVMGGQWGFGTISVHPIHGCVLLVHPVKSASSMQTLSTRAQSSGCYLTPLELSIAGISELTTFYQPQVKVRLFSKRQMKILLRCRPKSIPPNSDYEPTKEQWCGLLPSPGVATLDECSGQCSQSGRRCRVYQFLKGNASDGGCYLGGRSASACGMSKPGLWEGGVLTEYWFNERGDLEKWQGGSSSSGGTLVEVTRKKGNVKTTFI